MESWKRQQAGYRKFSRFFVPHNVTPACTVARLEHKAIEFEQRKEPGTKQFGLNETVLKQQKNFSLYFSSQGEG